MHEETQLTRLLDVPPELVLELAVGVDTFDNICQKFGYSPVETAQLRHDVSLKARVLKAESELQKDGFIHKHRAAFGADSILKILISRGMDPSTPLSVALDIYKELVKTGDLVPKQNTQINQGSGFSINIVMSDGTSALQIGNQSARTIEMENKKPILGASMNNALALPEDLEE